MRTEDRNLSYALAGVVATYAVLYRLVPYELQAFLLWPFGALALYGGSRLRWIVGVLMMFGVMAVTDAAFFLLNGWEPSPTAYAAFAAFTLLGVAMRPFLRMPAFTQVAGMMSASLLGYAVFFVATNTAAWASNALPSYAPHTFATWLTAMREGLEFLRTYPMQAIGNPLAVGLVFSMHLVLARRWASHRAVEMEHPR